MAKEVEQGTTPKLDELIAAADGSQYQQVMARIQPEVKRFIKAVNGEASEGEWRAAWRAYSRLAERTFRSGRLWAPEIVWLLAPVLIVACAEQDELERVTAACDAMPEASDDEAAAEQAARIKSPFSGIPTLLIADALMDALDCPREEGRIRAGYLTEEAQPSPKDSARPQ